MAKNQYIFASSLSFFIIVSQERAIWAAKPRFARSELRTLETRGTRQPAGEKNKEKQEKNVFLSDWRPRCSMLAARHLQIAFSPDSLLAVYRNHLSFVSNIFLSICTSHWLDDSHGKSHQSQSKPCAHVVSLLYSRCIILQTTCTCTILDYENRGKLRREESVTEEWVHG